MPALAIVEYIDFRPKLRRCAGDLTPVSAQSRFLDGFGQQTEELVHEARSHELRDAAGIKGLWRTSIGSNTRWYDRTQLS